MTNTVYHNHLSDSTTSLFSPQNDFNVTLAPVTINSPKSPKSSKKAQRSGALGITAKSASLSGSKRFDAKKLRWQLQSAAAALMPNERVASCMRSSPGAHASLTLSEHGIALGGVVTCGSVWHCPVCAQRIASKRSSDIEDAAGRWVSQGGKLAMLTLTMRHNAKQQLIDNLVDMREAYRAFTSGAGGAALRSVLGWKYSISALEVTHGFTAGWHVHLHILLFLQKQPDASWLRSARLRWLRVLGRHGRDARSDVGLDVVAADVAAARYVTKVSHTWAISSELAAGAAKSARGGNRNAIQLLGAAAAGDGIAAALWSEYAGTMKGRRWITWSRGLRSALGMDDELSDSEIVEQPEDEQQPEAARQTIMIPRESWRLLVKQQQRDALLIVACDALGMLSAVPAANVVMRWLDDAGAADCVLVPEHDLASWKAQHEHRSPS